MGVQKTDRNYALTEAVLRGATYKKAGEEFGVTPNRARQIYDYTLRNSRVTGGLRVPDFPAGFWDDEDYGVMRDRKFADFLLALLTKAREAER